MAGVDPDPAAEFAPYRADDPDFPDVLGRGAFAEVAAGWISESGPRPGERRLGRDPPPILHIDGAEGSGKSFILHLMGMHLERASPPWLVVHFDALENQHLKPCWWPLISGIGSAVVEGRRWYQLPKAWIIWVAWRWRMRWLPVAMATSLIATLTLIAIVVANSEKGVPGVPKAIADTVGGVLALIAIGTLGLTTGRKLLFGSETAVQSYLKTSSEPFRPISNMFERMTVAINKPVVVLIDNLDQCDANYLVDLLQAIQTVLRSAPVFYVVAGDRRWISARLERHHPDRGKESGSPGQSLGHRFFDRMFQFSISIPKLSTDQSRDYFGRLLQGGTSHPEHTDWKAREIEARGCPATEKGINPLQDAIQARYEVAPSEVIRAAAVRSLLKPDALHVARHRLLSLTHLLEPRPGSVARFVNAYRMNQALALIEGRNVSAEALARWTIMKLRWPLLAEYIADLWPAIASGRLSDENFPASIRELLLDSEVRAVIGADGDAGRLTVEALNPILMP